MLTYTAKQREVLGIISDSVRSRGIAPTLEEIASSLGGISRVSVLDHLRALERKGAIRRRPRESRAIEILDEDYSPHQGIPFAGTIAAGDPVLAVEEAERIGLEDYLGARDGCFLLRVTGDSMVDDHIVEGDLLLVEGSPTAQEGDIVVAIVADGGDGTGEATLKRFFRERGGGVRLVPANSRLRPISYAPGAVQIRGVVRGIVRRT